MKVVSSNFVQATQRSNADSKLCEEGRVGAQDHLEKDLSFERWVGFR